MTVQPLDAEQWGLIAAVGGALVAASVVFNAYIDRQADVDPEGAGSATFVVIGTGYTLFGAGLMLWIAFGAHVALWATAIAFACFAVAGLPMILGDIRRNARRRNAYHLELQQRAQEQTEQQIKDLGL